MMNINGITNRVAVLTAIKESVQAQRLDTAVDMLDQLIREESIDTTAKVPEVFADARDHHLIHQDLSRALGNKR
jgi:hypothetical protein